MNLRWNKFNETAEKAFRDLRSSGDFSDVTLAGADGKFLEAHKVILSSCSPVLRGILLKISQAHPLIYMKGMNIEDIGLLLKFIYTGEVTLEKENLESFLDTANELQIAGLTKPEGEKVAEMETLEDERKEEKKQTRPNNNSEIKDLVDKLETEFDSMEQKALQKSLNSDNKSEDEDSASQQIESGCMVDQSKEATYQGTTCEYPGCEKEFSTKANLRVHKRAIHEGIVHACSVCSYKTGFPGNLKKHIQKAHGEDQINHSLPKPMNIEEKSGQFQLFDSVDGESMDSEEPLNSKEPSVSELPLDSEEPLDSEVPLDSEEPLDSELPLDSEEPLNSMEPLDSVQPRGSEEPLDSEQSLDSDESKIHACDRCGIEKKSGKALMKHRREEHPGQNFLCKDCGKEFATNNNLNIHKKSIHELVKYPCGICDHLFTNKSHLGKHKKTKHTA